MTRIVLVHHHIFKNAGTTLDNSLRKVFGEQFSEINDESPEGTILPKELASYLKDNRHINAISSHHFHARLPERSLIDEFCRDFMLVHALMVRHPIARILSMYRYYRRREVRDALGERAKEMLAPEFVEYLMDHCPNCVNNAQVNIMARHGYYVSPPTEEHLDIAISQFSNFGIFGLVEAYSDTMVAAEYFLNPAFEDLNLAAKQANRTQNNNLTSEEEIEDYALYTLGRETYDTLAEMNALDRILWREAGRELNRRLGLIPHLARRRTDYSTRCVSM